MGYKILLVDDDTELVKMLSKYFERKKYRVITAQNGKEAIEKLQTAPDIILLDINMPQMDGLEVCRKIRDKISCPILFLTARVEEEDRVNGLLSGGDDYILKPFESTQIFHVLDDALALLPEQEAELSFEYRSFDVHFPLSKIQYIYSNNHEVIIHTTNGTHAFRLPFYSVTDHLDDSRFLQCNRGIMLNMDYIKTMESDYFEMTDSKCFPIKTKGRKQIREQYIKYQFLKLEEA